MSLPTAELFKDLSGSSLTPNSLPWTFNTIYKLVERKLTGKILSVSTPQDDNSTNPLRLRVELTSAEAFYIQVTVVVPFWKSHLTLSKSFFFFLTFMSSSLVLLLLVNSLYLSLNYKQMTKRFSLVCLHALMYFIVHAVYPEKTFWGCLVPCVHHADYDKGSQCT